MEIDIGRGKKGRRAYGFDDIAIVPSRRTRDPDDIDISWTLGPYRFELPLVASAMDGVVSPDTAVLVNEPDFDSRKRLPHVAWPPLTGEWIGQCHAELSHAVPLEQRVAGDLAPALESLHR